MVAQKKPKMPENINKRSDIYSKSLDLFIQKGYNGTSISVIAKTLGMSKSNLYHYCSSKEDLFYKVYLDYLEKRFIPLLEESEKVPDPENRLVFFLREFTLLNATDKATRVLVQDIINLNRDHHNEIVSIWRRAYDIVCGAIRVLQQSGKASKFRESFQTFLGFGMVLWTVYWFDYGRRINAEELAETLIQTFLHGLLRPVNGKKIETFQP